ncbi:transglycosylase SLT domain-containing protein, partial [Vibrio splendidus]
LRNYPNKSWVDVATDPVLNIRISADIFKGCLTYAKGNVWEAVGCYNSKTVNIKTNYLIRTMKTWDYILKRPSLNCSEYWYQ